MIHTAPAKLNTDVAAVKRALRKKTWMTLREIQTELNDKCVYIELQTVSARVRDLRKAKYGAHIVDRRYVGHGVWEYRLGKEAR